MRDKLGVREESASLGVMVGGAFNHDGTALYEAMSALCISQILGRHLGLGEQLIVVLMSILASVGAAGIPEAGTVTMLAVFNAVHLPVEYIPFLLPLAWRGEDRWEGLARRGGALVAGLALALLPAAVVVAGGVAWLARRERDRYDTMTALRLVDNGVIRARAEQMPGLPVIHAYHLVPAGASKARAVARHMQARGYGAADCIAVGDSREDLDAARVVDTFWLVANALERDPTLETELRGRRSVRIAQEAYGAGVYEAVVRTLTGG